MGKDLERQYIIIGAGGHAAVVADILFSWGFSVKGFLDDNVAVGTEVLDAKVLGGLDSHARHPDCLFIIGIGDNMARKRIALAYPLDYGIAIHPSAIIGQYVDIGRGTVLMAGSVVNPRSAIGEHCIINTRASVDHDSKVGDFAHISPGAALGGFVTIGSGSHVGIGACVRNTISICDNVVIGAGAAVVKDIATPGVYVGVPARQKRGMHS